MSNAVCMYRTHLNPKGCVLQIEEDCRECGRRTPKSGVMPVCEVARWVQERRLRAEEAMTSQIATEVAAAKAVAEVLDAVLAVCRQVTMEAAGRGV